MGIVLKTSFLSTVFYKTGYDFLPVLCLSCKPSTCLVNIFITYKPLKTNTQIFQNLILFFLLISKATKKERVPFFSVPFLK